MCRTGWWEGRGGRGPLQRWRGGLLLPWAKKKTQLNSPSNTFCLWALLACWPTFLIHTHTLYSACLTAWLMEHLQAVSPYRHALYDPSISEEPHTERNKSKSQKFLLGIRLSDYVKNRRTAWQIIRRPGWRLYKLLTSMHIIRILAVY